MDEEDIDGAIEDVIIDIIPQFHERLGEILSPEDVMEHQDRLFMKVKEIKVEALKDNYTTSYIYCAHLLRQYLSSMSSVDPKDMEGETA